jgi:hypothetical protein
MVAGDTARRRRRRFASSSVRVDCRAAGPLLISLECDVTRLSSISLESTWPQFTRLDIAAHLVVPFGEELNGTASARKDRNELPDLELVEGCNGPRGTVRGETSASQDREATQVLFAVNSNGEVLNSEREGAPSTVTRLSRGNCPRSLTSVTFSLRAKNHRNSGAGRSRFVGLRPCSPPLCTSRAAHRFNQQVRRNLDPIPKVQYRPIPHLRRVARPRFRVAGRRN